MIRPSSARSLLVPLVGVALVVVLAGCPRVRVDPEGRPCEAGSCDAGWVCSPLTDRCVRPVDVDCLTGLCPALIATGDACDHVGSFVSCTNQGVACTDGCRSCEAGHTWSGCVVDGCDIGRLESCASCSDDCTARIQHATAVCDRRGATPVCGRGACESGWHDADGNLTYGCEAPDCVPDCAGRCGGDDGCGVDCPAVACTGPETCGGGGRPGFCGWWWSCDWGYRRKLTLTAPASVSVPAGYAVSVPLNHVVMVGAGRSLASGDDLRLVHWTGASWDELERVADPTTPFDNAAGETSLWFKLGAGIDAGAVDETYYLYYGAPSAGAPPADESAVFPFADFFDRHDGLDVGGGWTVYSTATGYTGGLGIAGGALTFTGTGDTIYNRPIAEHGFTPPEGNLLYRIGFDWTGAAGDTWYRVPMQLGDGAVMENPPGPAQTDSATVGVGVSLVWAGDSTSGLYQRLYCESGGSLSDDCAPSTVSGPNEIAVKVDVTAKTYDVAVQGSTTKVGMAFSTAVGTLNRVRFMSRGVADSGTTHRAFDYVIVRARLATEPTAVLGGEETHICP